MFLSESQINNLKQGLECYQIDDIEQKIILFDEYAQNLYRWNEKINLTRVRKEEVEIRHFLDSLSPLKYETFSSDDIVLDMGTGAGFPGVPLKIVCPFLNITLLDSSLKRIDFLNYIVKKLKLENVNIVHSTIQDYQKIKQEAFTKVTARALSSLENLIKFSIPFLKKNGKMLFLKSEDDIKKDSDIINCNNNEFSVVIKDKIVFIEKRA